VSRWLSALLLVALLSLARSVGAATSCDSAVEAWVARCSTAEGVHLEIEACVPGTVVLHAPEAALDVEVKAPNARSFRVAGGAGFSPVGEYSDWSKQSEARRRALDSLLRCAGARPVPLPRAGPGDAAGLRVLSPPWLLIAAFALLAARALSARSRFGPRRRDALVALGLGLAAGAFRLALIPFAFFHQNGQGAGWIGYALHDDAGLAGYGVGYPEVFAAAARLFRADPERGVFLLQAVLGALAVSLVYVIARRAGARTWIAAALALAAGCDPVLGRLAHSESYFGVELSLLMLGTASAALADARVSRRFVLSLAAAGLFAAEAARVHPSAWPAAALVPLPVLLGPGSWRRRVPLGASAAGVVFAVVGLTSFATLAATWHGPIGHHWLPHTRPRFELLVQSPLPLLLALALVSGAALRSWRGAVIALFAVSVLALSRLTDLLSDPNPAVTAAHQRLFVPALVVLIAAWFASVTRTPRAAQIGATLLVGAAVVLSRARWTELSALPTDGLEARFVRLARSRIEPHAAVGYVERAGTRVDILPLYDGVTAARVPLAAEKPIGSLSELPRPAYWFHSSLCSTAEASGVCERLERSAPLELVAERTLPARPSMRWNGYLGDSVHVALYRVK
jgi:hypothetical protein